MEVKEETANEFLSILISRGLGIYGHDRMVKICGNSGILLNDDDSFNLTSTNDLSTILNQFIVNYSQFNLPAKMTAMVLAKKFQIPIPDTLKQKPKKKSRFRRLLERRSS